MANQQAAPITAAQVGSYFVQQYYQVFQQQQDYVHQFYNDSSSVIRVDGGTCHSASDIVNIHQLIMLQNFTGIEIKAINSLESWSGGVLVVVSGSVKSTDFDGARQFVQTFFLAPQEKGYFVLNDMFHFADDEENLQSSVPEAEEQNVDYQPAISSHLSDAPVTDYHEEVAADKYVDSIHIEGDEPVQEFSYLEHQQHHIEGDEPVQGFSYQEHHQHVPELQPQPEPEPEPVPVPDVNILEEEAPIKDTRALLPLEVTTNVQEHQPSAEEHVGEPEKLTYASILLAKGKTQSSFISPPAFTQRKPRASDWNHVPQPSLQQTAPSLPNSKGPSLQQTAPSLPNSVGYAMEETLPSKEGEYKSVYVRNLPSTITNSEILQEFKNFGKIKPDGVFLRNRMDAGVCYAFVEFEDLPSVQNALQASPIQLGGRNVYIEERRPNSSASRGGRSGGRGGGGRVGRFSGRGN